MSFENYQRNTLATHLTDTSINSLCEDLDPVRARLEIAKARGWRSVEIRGSAASKHEASAAKSFSVDLILDHLLAVLDIGVTHSPICDIRSRG